MPRLTFLSLTNALENFITPPCTGAAVAVWLSFALFFFCNRSDALWQGDLSNPDDYLYLVQAIDWLQGQSWFDLIQHRMDPPQGTFIHYSHLLSGFYAGFIFLLRPFFGTLSAALITAALLPLLYLACFLFILRRVAQNLIDQKWGDMTACVILVSPVIMSQFWIGAIHHHGVEAILATTALYSITHMVMNPERIGWALLAGFALALGLAIGLEIIAIVGMFSLCIGVWAAFEGGRALRNGCYFASTLFLGSFGFLLVTRSPEHLFDLIIPAYSIVYVVFTGCISFCFICVALLGHKVSSLMRCAIGAAVAAASAIVFLHWFPALNEGPYGGVDPSLAKLIFFSEPEAWPGVRGGAPLSRQILPTVWPLIAIASNLYILAHCEGRTKRWLWGIVLISLTICAGLALFYQCRFFDYAQPLASLPLVAMVKHDWEISSATYKEHFYRITRLLLVLVIGPSTFLLASSNFNDAPFEKSELTAASAQAPLKGCDMHQLADLLNDKKGLGSRQRIIINSLNEGSELLFRTHDSVLAGPYHLNFQGNMDALHFFTTADPNEAKAIADNRNASLVVFCKMPSQLRAYRNGATTFVKSAFIQQLIDGNIPTWMTQVQSAQLDDLMVFEIK